MTRRTQSPRSLRADALTAISEDLGWHTRLVARQISTELDLGLASSGLTSVQFSLMCLIAAAPDDTLGALAQRAGLSQSTMSRNVDLLAKEDLVEVAMVAEDRRRRLVWLTETGAAKLARAMPLWRAAHRALVGRLGPVPSRHFIDVAMSFL